MEVGIAQRHKNEEERVPVRWDLAHLASSKCKPATPLLLNDHQTVLSAPPSL